MNEQQSGLKRLYESRENFIIIGLTGRTGSGCSTAAELLTKSIDKLKLPKPVRSKDADNEARKYEIIYRYAKNNWTQFHWIQIRDVITSFIVENKFEDFSNYIASNLDRLGIAKADILLRLKDLVEDDYNKMYEQRQVLKRLRIETEGIAAVDTEKVKQRRLKAHDFYFNYLPPFTNKLKTILNEISEEAYTSVYQSIGDNIRASGSALNEKFDSLNIFRIAIRVNKLIKIFTNRAKETGEKVCMVIDALRNPFEASYFRERYAAFYLIAINTISEHRIKRLQKAHHMNDEQIAMLDKKEYPERLEGISIFTSQNIKKCIQLADIHVNNPHVGEKDLSTLKRQLIYYVTLIIHPGLVMPSRAERCMQIAHAAKLNSGCMSRQVGAVVTDRYYSIKSVGWNTSPEGQTPCMLRSVDNFLNHDDKTAFSEYENHNVKFRKIVSKNYSEKIESEDVKKTLNGRNVSFCFKDMKNELDDNSNQVFTRSLHAEENAFLQLAKYGSNGIKDGVLFTTASPCELCAKKAYQLGIKEIVYIDPYPGIALEHILQSGVNKPDLVLFHGAIGRAYTQLYDPIVPYKDELRMILQI